MSDSCLTCQHVRIVDRDGSPAMECHLNPPDPSFPVLEQVQIQDYELGTVDIEEPEPFEPVPQQRYPHVDPDDWCSFHLSDDDQRWLNLLVTGALLWFAITVPLAVVVLTFRLFST